MIAIRFVETSDELAAVAASLAAQSLSEALTSKAQVTFALAGGRIPPIATRILSKKYTSDLDWKRIVFLIGDERCVPLDDPESSWLSALPLFMDHPEIPSEHMLRPQSQLSAELAANAYVETLLKLQRNDSGLPVINHLWMGIGEDGHTLSLFPNNPAFTQATDTLVIPVHNSPKPPPNRISFSLKALQGVRSAVVFISGESKAPIVAQIASGDRSLPVVVASHVIEQAGGHVTWLVDKEALSLLPEGQSLNVS